MSKTKMSILIAFLSILLTGMNCRDLMQDRLKYLRTSEDAERESSQRENPQRNQTSPCNGTSFLQLEEVFIKDDIEQSGHRVCQYKTTITNTHPSATIQVYLLSYTEDGSQNIMQTSWGVWDTLAPGKSVSYESSTYFFPAGTGDDADDFTPEYASKDILAGVYGHLWTKECYEDLADDFLNKNYEIIAQHFCK